MPQRKTGKLLMKGETTKAARVRGGRKAVAWWAGLEPKERGKILEGLEPWDGKTERRRRIKQDNLF